jgi:pyrroline-5-carboxylate reductase
MITNVNIAIIGCGNLGASIANGLLTIPGFDPKRLTLTKRNIASLSDFQERGAIVTSNNLDAISNAELVILGVKPYNVTPILNEILPGINPKNQIIISLATGITLAEMYQVLPKKTVTFRAMPNIAADIQESVTCVCSQHASDVQLKLVTDLFDSIGFTIPIDESLM